MSDRKTITLELGSTLRLAVGDDLIAKVSDAHDLICLSASVQTEAEEQLSIELVVSPETAAGLLAMLRDLESEGRIPTGIVRSVKTTRQ